MIYKSGSKHINLSTLGTIDSNLYKPDSERFNAALKVYINNFVQLENINPTFFPVVQDTLRCAHPPMYPGVNGSTLQIIQRKSSPRSGALSPTSRAPGNFVLSRKLTHRARFQTHVQNSGVY